MITAIYGEYAKLLQALAHPRRLEIIHLLRDQELCVTDIYSMLDLPQANISQHLMVLKDCGVVTTRRQGKHMYYTVRDKRLVEACDMFKDISLTLHPELATSPEAAANLAALTPLVHDPVCHMQLSPKTAGFTARYEGRTYYFCASGCLKHFHQKPQKYVQSRVLVEK